ncbi:MAG TPA: MogA/MoaB family molybdenum cofactor biosynthesis protein [Thermoplasmatales archaeon]|nr:MogA/MoaB family molybdenum cofactor biosynthesis protein [Thermoplasmatales archaeon]
MGVEEHKKHAIQNISFALITVSDSRNEATDESGALIKEMAGKEGHSITEYRIIKNDRKEIEDVVKELLDRRDVDAILFCGGTGISSKDITVDTVKPFLEKELPGFGEMFRMLSMQEIGTAAMLSRAIAGIARRKAIFCIPGSKNAVKLAMEKIILEECGHILWEARK